MKWGPSSVRTKRKEYYDFVYSEQYGGKIINDFDFFKNYIAEVIRDSQYVYILTDYKLKRKESIILKFNNDKSKFIHLLIRNSQKEGILYEYELKRWKSILIIINLSLEIDIYFWFFTKKEHPHYYKRWQLVQKRILQLI